MTQEQQTTTILNISGGKDSTALLLYALDQGTPNILPVFADTGHEHPQTVAYVDYLEQRTGVQIKRVRADFSANIERRRGMLAGIWSAEGISQERIDRALALLKPSGNPFLDLCLWKGRFPSAKFRFCTSELKVIPILKQIILPIMSTGSPIEQWVGVRAQESKARAAMEEREWIDPGLWMVRPILQWTVEDVFAIHKRMDVEPNPLYMQGMGRVGCLPCIMARKGELAEIASRWPEEVERVQQWEALVSEVSKLGKSTIFAIADGHGEGIKEVMTWARTARGGKQLDLGKWIAAQDTTQCSSIYGLCE